MFTFLPDLVNGLRLKPSKYSIVNPQPVHRRTRSINRPQQSKEVGSNPDQMIFNWYFNLETLRVLSWFYVFQNYGEETVSYVLDINNRQHVLHLQRNRYTQSLVTDVCKDLVNASDEISHVFYFLFLSETFYTQTLFSIHVQTPLVTTRCHILNQM